MPGDHDRAQARDSIPGPPLDVHGAAGVEAVRGRDLLHDLVEIKERTSEDFTELVTVRLGEGEDAVEVEGTGVGPRNAPHLVGVWGERFNMPFADHLAIFRYRDQPGMIGRVGQAFGEHGVNIVSAAVGAEAGSDRAVMALTTDAPVPDEVVQEIATTDGFDAGRAVDV